MKYVTAFLTALIVTTLCLTAYAQVTKINAQPVTPNVEGLYGGWTAVEYEAPSTDLCNTIQAQQFASIFEVTLVAKFNAVGQEWDLYDPTVPSNVNTLEFVCHEDIVWIYLDAPVGTLQGQWIQH